MDKTSTIYLAGHRGMVGSAIGRELARQGYTNVLTQTRDALDLTRQQAVEEFFRSRRPEFVFLAAAKVGGIGANMGDQAEFLLRNLQIACNVLDAAFRYGVRKLLFLGSSCIYPREAPPPIPEGALLTGPLEPTNEGYALAKIAGLKLCEFYNRQQGAPFICLMPCNLYGPGDTFDLETSHMLPALVRKFHEAKVRGDEAVPVWGTGRVRRELMYVEDLARACLFAMDRYDGPEFLNVGWGQDFTIADIAEKVRVAVGYAGGIVYEREKPEGMARKLMDSGKIRSLGWRPTVPLEEGLRLTYQWYLGNVGR
jgi:GDP-L-fucose synthase